MTSAPKSKRIIISNQKELDAFIDQLNELASWADVEGDRPYKKGKFYIEIEQSGEWFYSEEAHQKSKKSAEKFSERGF